MDVSHAGALIAGLLSFLSPCVLPLVPPYIFFIGGVGAEQILENEQIDRRLATRILVAAFMFVLGFSTVFIALGATASTLGQFIADYFDILSWIAGGVIIVLGLHFLGIFKISALFREVRYHAAARPAGFLGAYVVGLAFAFGWTPCVGPVLAAVLMVAAGEDTVMRGVSLLGLYSLGIGIPFLIAAAAIGPFMRFMQKFRKYIPVVEKSMGVLLVGTGLLIATGSMAEIANWLLETFPAFSQVG